MCKGTTFFYYAMFMPLFFENFVLPINPPKFVILFAGQELDGLIHKELIVPNQQIDHRHRDIGIGQIEYSAEEVVVVVN